MKEEKDHYVSVIVTKKDYAHHLLLDEKPTKGFAKWTGVHDGRGLILGYVREFPISRTVHSLSLASGGSLTAMVILYGIQDTSAYACVLGEMYVQSK